MAGRSLVLAALLAGISLAAGLVDPIEPFDGHHLFVASPDAQVLFEFDAGGDLQPTKVTGLTSIHDLAFGPDGALYATDFDLDRVLVYDASGDELVAFGEGSDLDEPTDLAFGPAGGLYVASSATDSVLVFARDGSVSDTFGEGSGLDDPRGLAFSPDGRLWVSSFGTDEVLVFDPSGVLVDTLSDVALQGPYGLAFAPQGHLLVASRDTDRVLEFDGAGDVVASFGAGSGLESPTAIAIGPDRNLYVASEGSDAVLVFDADGSLLDTITTGELFGPTGLAFSPAVFSATIKGRLARSGQGDDKLTSTARVTWSPGSGWMTLLLTDVGDDMSELFGGDALVLSGFEVTESGDSKTRHVAARELQGDAQATAITSVGIVFKGGVDDDDSYEPGKATGYFHRAGPGGSVDATIKLKKQN